MVFIQNWKLSGLLLFLILAWGFSYPITKIGVVNLAPFTLNFFRFFLGAMVLFFVIWIRSRKIQYKRLPLIKIIILGSIQTLLLFGLSSLGIQFIDSGETSILLYTMPIWTSILAIFFLGEEIVYRKFVGLSLAIIGLLTIIGNEVFSATDTMSILGYGLVILAALAWSIASVYYKLNFNNYDPLIVTAAQMTVGCIMLGVLALLFEREALNLQWSENVIWSMLYLGIVASSICFVIWFYLIQKINVTTLSLTSLLVPIVSIIAGVVTINESLTFNKVFGSLILLGGLVISQTTFLSKIKLKCI